MPDDVTISLVAEKYLRLHLCPEIGPIRFARLLERFGDIDGVLGASVTSMAAVDRVSLRLAEDLARNRDGIDVAAEIALARKHGVRVVCRADEDYPVALRSIPDPPPVLYVRGAIQRQDALALAVVGTRRCSHYGREQAERFAALAANAGMTIVSGMARGIDTHAHQGALAAGGRTIAVLGCGLCHLYPPESTELAARVVEHGAVISELPMQIVPDPKNFPQRNRIIVGLSLGVLVVEAPARSGALISARLASEYNREVFAVPGRVDWPATEGCHDLIRSGAARLVTCLRDVLEELGQAGAALMTPVEPQASAGPRRAPLASLSEHEQAVLAVFGSQALSIEMGCELAGLPPGRAAATLTALQLKSVIRRVDGDLYEAVRAP